MKISTRIVEIEADQPYDKIVVDEEYAAGKRFIAIGMAAPFSQIPGIDQEAASTTARMLFTDAQAAELLTTLGEKLERDVREEATARLAKRIETGLRTLHYHKNDLYDLRSKLRDRVGEALYELFAIDKPISDAIDAVEEAMGELHGIPKEKK